MTVQFTAKLYAGPYPAIREELARGLGEETGRDPVGEKIVLTPSNYSAEDLYEAIARERGRATVNVRAMTLLDFARRLLKHRKLLLPEIDAMTRAVLLSGVVDAFCRKRGEKGAFAGVYGKKGFISALLRLFEEFEEGMISGREAESLLGRPGFLRAFPDPSKISDILSLYTAFFSAVERAGFTTRTHLVRLASEGFEVPGYPFRVKLYGFYDFTRIQWLLVQKLIDSGLMEAVYFPLPTAPGRAGTMVIDDFKTLAEVVPEGYRYGENTLWKLLRRFDGNVTLLGHEKNGEKSARRVRDALFRNEFSGKKEGLPFPLISAPHGPGELRAVARLIKKTMRERGGEGKIGLIYRQLDETVLPDIERVLDEFDIPGLIARAGPLIRAAPVRTLIGLVKLPLRNYQRRETVDMLTSPSFDVSKLHPGSERHSPLWDHLTKKIGISQGDDWGHKLQRFIVKSKKIVNNDVSDVFDDSDDGDAPSRAHLATGREVASAEALAGCFAALRAFTEPLLSCGSYAALAESTLSLLRRLIVITGEEEVFGLNERAVKRATKILTTFGELDWRGVAFPGPRSAIELLETIFSEERMPHHGPGSSRAGAAVVAGDVMSLRGVTFDSIYLLGANEGVWPRAKKDVSLLKDEEREVFLSELSEPDLPPALSRMRENVPEEKLLFCLPFIMGKGIGGVSFLRSDMSGAKRAPSPFLMDLAFRFRGPDIFFGGLSAETAGSAFHEFPRQLKVRLSAPGDPSPREALIASLMSGGASDSLPVLSGPAKRILLRTAETLSRWQRGEDLAPDPGSIAGMRIPEGRLNHTFLESFIQCPYKTFLRYGLKLEPLPEPEEVFSLGRLEMGIIAHRALYILHREVPEDSRPAAVEDAVKRALSQYGRDNPLGLRGLAAIAVKSLSKTISAYLAWEKEHLGDLAPELFEVTFGFQEGRHVSIDVSGEQVHISGKIDRIDRSGETIRVLDYKLSAGNRYTPLEEKISLALLNQIPLYATAARKILADRGTEVRTVTGGYIALKRDGKKGYLIATLLDREGEMVSRWERSLSLLFKGLKSRMFPPMADHLFKMARWRDRYCEHCDYADICRVSPATTGNDVVALSLRERFSRLFPGLRWHVENREPS